MSALLPVLQPLLSCSSWAWNLQAAIGAKCLHQSRCRILSASSVPQLDARRRQAPALEPDAADGAADAGGDQLVVGAGRGRRQVPGCARARILQCCGGGVPAPLPAVIQPAPAPPLSPSIDPTLPTRAAGKGTQYKTKRNPWTGSLGRPGNEYQDSLSALSTLGPEYYTGFHTYGVDWRPGQVLERGAGRRGGCLGCAAMGAQRAPPPPPRAPPPPSLSRSICAGTSTACCCTRSTSRRWWRRATAQRAWASGSYLWSPCTSSSSKSSQRDHKLGCCCC